VQLEPSEQRAMAESRARVVLQKCKRLRVFQASLAALDPALKARGIEPQFALFGMQNRAFKPYLMTDNRCQTQQ
jgi:hypothetical protein